MWSLIHIERIAALAAWIALPPLTSTYLMAVLLWLSLAAFAVLGGADFGAGFWDLLAVGRTAEQVRGALIQAIGPIWEANEIWLIFLVTGLFTAFPLVFSTLSIALFVPAVFALIGVVLRGAGFIYYSHFREEAPVRHGWGSVFSLSSLIAPFFFGVMAGTVASGRIRVSNGATILSSLGYISIWLTPFSLMCGLYAIAMCALLAAVYMIVETRNTGDQELVTLFRHCAYYAYAATGICGLVAGGLGAIDAPGVWTNLVGRALPLALATAALGVALVILLKFGAYLLARIAVAGVVTGIIITWGVAQYPYLVPPDLTVTNTAAPSSVMAPLLISSVIGMALILPSLWFLFYLFKSRNRPQPVTSAEKYASEQSTAEEKMAPRFQGSHEERKQEKQLKKKWVGAAMKVGMGMLAVLVAFAAWWLMQRRETTVF
jgi:cytochrome d ubiquinol oxidase subunit II